MAPRHDLSAPLRRDSDDDEGGCCSCLARLRALAICVLILGLAAAAGVLALLWRLALARPMPTVDGGDLAVRRALNGLYFATNPSGSDWGRCDSKSVGGSAWGNLNHYCEWKCVECAKDRSVIGLRLQKNGLTGTVPRIISSIKTLRHLDLAANPGLVGTLPEEIGQIPALETLLLNYTRLSGSLPASMASLSRLRDVSAAHARLTGVLPTGLPPLRLLDMQDNMLSGGLKHWPATVSWLQHNRFSGSLPADPPPKADGMQPAIDISYNNMSGPLPANLDPHLTTLKVMCFPNGKTCIDGTLPSSLGKLTALEHLELANNHLSGTISPALGALTRLQFLFLEENRLSGTLPAGLALIMSRLDDSTCNIEDNCLSMGISKLCSSQQRASCSP